MPYKFTYQKLKIPRALDRRIKLTDTDKENIKTMYFFERLAIREIARQYSKKCSRKLIQLILFPERLDRLRAQYKERRKDKRYYDRAKNTKAMRAHRQYKQSIKDKLIPAKGGEKNAV